MGGTSGPDASTNPASITGPTANAGPAVTRPIRIGFLTIDYSKASETAGLSTGAAFDWKANYQALGDPG